MLFGASCAIHTLCKAFVESWEGCEGSDRLRAGEAEAAAVCAGGHGACIASSGAHESALGHRHRQFRRLARQRRWRRLPEARAGICGRCGREEGTPAAHGLEGDGAYSL